MSRLQAVIAAKAETIREIVARNGAVNPRLFGSVARGEDGPDSDIDLLVEAGLGRFTGFDMFEIEERLEELLGTKVDVVTLGFVHPDFRSHMLRYQTVRPALWVAAWRRITDRRLNLAGS